MNSDRRGITAIAFAAVMLSAACGQTAPSTLGSQLTIGAIQPLSGAQGEFGHYDLDGVNLAVSQLNAVGGCDGAHVVANVQDDNTDKAQTVSLFRQLAEQTDTVAMIGPAYSATFIASAPLAEQYKIAYLSDGSNATWPGDFNDYTFRVSTVLKYLTPQVIEATVKKFNAKTAAIIYQTDNVTTVSGRDLTKQKLASLNVKVVADEGITGGTTNFSVQVTKFSSAHPDILILALITNEAALFSKQARASGLQQPLVSPTQGLSGPQLFSLSEGAANGLVAGLPYSEGETRPVVQKFLTGFQKMFNRTPNPISAYGYDAVNLICDAAKRAKTTTDRVKLRNSLGATKGYEGVAGFYTYENKGDNTRPTLALVQLTRDGFVPFK
jgi:branched-chain amino acid transport system substrate-binding protein